jgi:NAD(P)-dependent dehydrogenase (short-subunit alcohol dehydrogenase family)
MSQTVLITGASTGIGKATAKVFAANNWNVIVTMRVPDAEKDLANRDNVLTTRLDVLDRDSIAQTVKAGIGRFGKIDVLINNAGFSLFGVFETIPPEKIREQFAINVTGVMDVTRALLPHFRQNKAGTIINISSRAGLVGLPLISLYCATKHALEGFSEALAYELASQNIVVKLIEPSGGVAHTNFADRMGKEQTPGTALPDYEAFVAQTGKVFSELSAAPKITADEVAQAIFAAATDGTHRLRYFIGEDSGGFLQARRELSGEAYFDFMRSRFLPPGTGRTGQNPP